MSSQQEQEKEGEGESGRVAAQQAVQTAQQAVQHLQETLQHNRVSSRQALQEALDRTLPPGAEAELHKLRKSLLQEEEHFRKQKHQNRLGRLRDLENSLHEHIRRLEDEAKESEVVFEKERLAHRQAVEAKLKRLVEEDLPTHLRGPAGLLDDEE